MEHQATAMSPLPPPFPTAEPAAGAERLVTLDVIRGIAILGILMVNIQTFAMIDIVRDNPAAAGELTDANFHIWHAMHVFFDGKFHTIFAALFGAGIVLMTDRAARVSVAPLTFHFRRMAGLFVIGMLHAYLIWHGDILVAYALCGLVVVWFRAVRTRWLIALASCMLLVPPLILLGWYGLVMLFPEHAIPAVMEEFWPSQEEITRQTAVYQGSWFDQMPSRALASLVLQTLIFAIYTFWRAAAIMLLGMVLFRAGILTGARSTRFYVAALGVAGVLGVVVVEIGVQMRMAKDWDPLFYTGIGHQFNYWGSLLAALAWISLGVLLTRAQLLRRLSWALAAVGRMALTNYLMQSVICTWIFYGHGLGWYGETQRPTQLFIVIAVWLFQLIVSPLWLRRHAFGPIEYLWRWATYGHRPSLRARAVAVAPAQL